MKEDKFDNMYEGRFDALQKKYEAEIAIAISASYFFCKASNLPSYILSNLSSVIFYPSQLKHSTSSSLTLCTLIFTFSALRAASDLK